MIREGERRGALRPGKDILDATSGNTGIAYAMIGAALGYRVKLCLPSSASPERKQILQAYGAEIVFTPGDEGSDGAIRRVREIYAADPTNIFIPISTAIRPIRGALPDHRAGNLGADARAHHPFRRGPGNQRHICRHHAAPEGIESAIRCISLQPDSGFHGLEGWKHMATAIVPAIYDPTLADEDIDSAHRRRATDGEAARARRGHSRRRQRRRGAVGLHRSRAPLAARMSAP